jgi:hypothetical protein
MYRYNKWLREGILSFVPPDGKFKLFEFQGAPQSRSLPLALKPGLVIEENGGESIYKSCADIRSFLSDTIIQDQSHSRGYCG